MIKLIKKTLPYLLLSGTLLSCEKDLVNEYTPIIENEKIQYNENVIQLTQDELNKIENIDEDYIYFNDKSSLEVGDFFVGGISSKTPNGIMRKVESCIESKIKTRDASLEEIIKSGELHLEKKLSTYDANNFNNDFLKSKNFEYDFHKVIDIIVYDQDGDSSTINDQAKIVGDFYFNCGFTFDATFDYGIKEVEISPYLHGFLDAKIYGDLETEFYKREKLLNIPFSPIPIGTSGIIVVPKLEVMLGVDAKMNGDFYLPFSSNGELNGKLKYDDGKWDTDWNKSLELNSENYIFNLDCYARGFVSPNFTININGILGPFFEIEKYVELDFDYSNKSLWEMNGGINFNVGCNAGVFSFLIPEYKETIFQYEKNIRNGEIENENFNLISDDGIAESYWAYPGYCNETSYSELSYIEKKFDIPSHPFNVEKVEILFTEKATNNSDYIIYVRDESRMKKSILIDAENIELNKWYSHELDEPIEIENSLTIWGTDKNDSSNCGNPEIHGWGIGIDTDNDGDSYIKVHGVDYNFNAYSSYYSADGEFLIRVSGY